MRIVLVILCLITLNLPVGAEVVKVSLDEAVQLTLRSNLDLQAKRKELGIAYQDIKIANKLQNPQFQSNILIGSVRESNSSQFGLMLPVEVMKRGVRKKAAIAQRKLVESQIHQYEHDLKIKVMSSYFNVLYYKSIVKIMNERKGLFQEMHGIAGTKAKNSANYKIDILQSDIKLKKQLIELNRSKADLMSSQFNLNKVFNIPQSENMYDVKESSLFSEDLSILDINLPPYEIVEGIAMKYSHSIRIADDNIEKLNQEYILSTRQRIPDIMIGGGYAWQARYHGNGLDLPGAYVSSGFNIPVLYTFRPEIEKSKIILEKAKMDKVSFENKLKITLKQNYNNFKYAKENMKYYKEILKESDEILKMSTTRYREGKTTLMNLILIENSHQQILNEYIVAMEFYYGIYLDMMHNMGHDVLLEEEIFEEL